MSGKAIVITSGKGGVGKTTATANIGSVLASEGQRTALIDVDIGLRNLDVLLGLENRIVYDLVNVVEGECRLEQALIKDKRNSNLFLMPAAQTRDKDAVSPEEVQELVEKLKEEFDFVLIDSPAGIEQGFRNAVAGADEAVIITTPEVSALRDADRIIGMLQAAGLDDPRVVINRINREMVKKGDMLDVADMLEVLAISLLGVIPDDERIVVSTNRGEPVVFDSSSQAGEAFRNVGLRLLGQEVPFLSWEKKGLFSRIKSIMGF